MIRHGTPVENHWSRIRDPRAPSLQQPSAQFYRKSLGAPKKVLLKCQYRLALILHCASAQYVLPFTAFVCVQQNYYKISKIQKTTPKNYNVQILLITKFKNKTIETNKLYKNYTTVLR